MFVKFTLGDIRAAVKDKLDDDGFPDATIDRAANDFQFELFNANRIRFMEASEELSVGEGETRVDFPDDFMTLINLMAIDSTTVFRDITKRNINYDDFMTQYGNYSVANASKIYDWTFYGEGIRFQSPTAAVYTLGLDYLRSPELMEDEGDECELPISSRELMTLGTLERCMRVNEDYNESNEESAHLKDLRRAFVKNYGRGGAQVGPQIIKSGRRGRGGGAYRPDRDM